MGHVISKNHVGREAELEQLRGTFTNARKGCGSLVVIRGEKGIGKTTLLHRFAAEAAQNGATVFSENFSGQQFEPYAPFLRVIEQLGDREGSPCRGFPADHKTDSVDGREHTKSDHSDLEALFALQKGSSIAQQSVASAILAGANRKILILAFDDAHSAPLTTWRFIHYLTSRIQNKKILLAITVAEERQGPHKEEIPAYTDVLQRMNREGLVAQIELKRFTVGQVRSFLHQVFPKRDFSRNLDRTIHQISHGNPALLLKSLNSLKSKGLLYKKGVVWYDDERAAKEAFRELITDKAALQEAAGLVASLSSTHLALLQYAALMCGSIEHGVLSEILNRPRVLVVKDLIALKEHDILMPQGEDKYQFKHHAVRTVLLDRLTQESKQAMHYELATQIEKQARFNSSEAINLMAYHYSRSKDRKLAFRYLNQAGLKALANFAFIEAKAYFEQALSALDSGNWQEPSATKTQLLTRLAWLDHVLGYWQQAIEHCRKAWQLCTADTDIKFKMQLLIQEGLTYFRLNDWSNSLACLETCLQNSSQLSQWELAMANYGIGDVHFEMAQYDQARQHFQEALTIAKQLNNKQLLANILNNLGAVENVRSEHLRAISLYSECISIYQYMADDLGLARIYHNIGMSHADQKNWQEANTFYGKSLGISDSLGIRPLKSITFLNRALALAYMRNFEAAREYNFKALELLKHLDDDLGIAEYHKIQGVIEREQGDGATACEQFNRALQQFQAMGNKLGVAETLHEMGLLESAPGEDKEGVDYLDQAREGYQELGLHQKVKVVEQLIENVAETSLPT